MRLLVAVEPEPFLRQQAAAAAEAALVPVRVVAAGADRLPLTDASVDGVVVSGVLCSVPDPPAALAELRRVLRPGGELRYYEHARAGGWLRSRYQDAANLLWPRLMGGCHPNRDAGHQRPRWGNRRRTEASTRKRLMSAAASTRRTTPGMSFRGSPVRALVVPR